MHLQETSTFGAKHFICSLHLPILCFVEKQHLYVLESDCIQAGLPACFAKCNLCYSSSNCNPNYSGNASELGGSRKLLTLLVWILGQLRTEFSTGASLPQRDPNLIPQILAIKADENRAWRGTREHL